MRYLYGESDEKFVTAKDIPVPKKIEPLSSYKYRKNAITSGKSKFDRDDIPIIFKCTPDSLVNLCVQIIDAMPLQFVFKWNIEDICRWLRKYGYPQYQNTFRENLINGHTFLLLDASALSAMNIKDFDHMKHIAYGIRGLFYFEMTKFGRSITLAPDFHMELYKLFRIKTGAKYEKVRRSDLWRRMQLVREKAPNYSHWELLERWMAMLPDPKYPERFGKVRRNILYKCKTATASKFMEPKIPIRCACLPPCQCHWDVNDVRPPWRFQCLPHLQPDTEFIEKCKDCMPPCMCRWTSKKFMSNEVLQCLKDMFPHKYGIVSLQRRMTSQAKHVRVH